jgi:nucleoside-diphosphate-sugar epimerase
MNVFVTGTTGYIGGSVAQRLMADGHHIIGLVRSQQGADRLRERGIEPVVGSLNDLGVLREAARRADAVVNAADSDHPFVVSTILPILEGTGKAFLQTSGSSVVADMAAGEATDRVYDDLPENPMAAKAGRVAIDRTVLAAAERGVRSVVLCPSMIYGEGRGVHRDSIQIPWMIELAKECGVARHIGRGENVWSHVHIDDVAEAYSLALNKAPAGSFFLLESGEASFRNIGSAIGRMLGFGGRTEDWPLEEAIRRWGPEAAHFAFGSNSRVRSGQIRQALGWRPKGPALLAEIERGCYRR